MQLSRWAACSSHEGGDIILYGPNNEPLLESTPGLLLEADSTLSGLDPNAYGGWSASPGNLNPNSITGGSFTALRVNRDIQRRAARIAYLTNPLLYGAVEVIHSFVLGTGVTVGEIPDKRASEAVTDFWDENRMSSLLDRMFTEYMLDGESLPVWPGQANDAGRNAPAHIALADVDRGITLDLDPFDSTQVIGARLTNTYGEARQFNQGQFVFHAHDSLWNDPRGWPVVMRAIPACLAYTGFLERRLRLHDIQSRINAVYKAFAKTAAEHQAKASMFGQVPADGRIITLAKNDQTGMAEEFDFVTQKVGAVDADIDARLIRLLAAVALGLPGHYMSDGGDVNLATASAMGLPARKGFQRKQRWVEMWLDDVMKTELERRYGQGQLYTITETKISPNGLGKIVTKRKVTARKLKLPWSFPSLEDESVADLMTKIQTASNLSLASRGTLSGMAGFDYAAEVGLLAAQKVANPPPVIQPVTQPDPDPKTPPDPEAEADAPKGE